MPTNKQATARTSRPTTAQISAAVVCLMQAGDAHAAVIKWMQAREKRERTEERRPRKNSKQTFYSKTGRKIELYRTDVRRMSTHEKTA